MGSSLMNCLYMNVQGLQILVNQPSYNAQVLLGRRCSTSTDIWSLGIVLYEIVMGEVPRRGDMEPIR